MYYTTGFSRCEIEDLCALVAEVQSSVPVADRRDWPPILGLGNSVVVTLAYLRRNRVQWELAETYAVSQSTISRAISAVTPLLARALARFVPVADELVPGRQYIVDGTLTIDPADEKIVLQYFRLSEDELELHADGWISERTWAVWQA